MRHYMSLWRNISNNSYMTSLMLGFDQEDVRLRSRVALFINNTILVHCTLLLVLHEMILSIRFDLQDRINSFILNSNLQVDLACAMIRADTRLWGGYNAVGASQGSQFLCAPTHSSHVLSVA